ncbi:MAG: cyclic nucleotide-binding domain-containing protein [Chloroflexi bacterium]|nr:cyclic nucleotide-binding domain-containing protein [Chloroflexota bacterium]
MIESFQKIDFIRKTHLFRRLTDEELAAIAEKLADKIYAPGEAIVRQGQESDYFYLIYSGKVNVTRRTGSGEQTLAELVDGDHFGEDALLKQTRRTATVTAIEQTTLLTLSRTEFTSLLKKIVGLRSKFEVTVASHRLARQTRFSWLEEGEVVYFVTRKHQIVLLQSLAGPILGLLVPVIALIMFLFNPLSSALLWTAGIAILLLAVWIFLKWLDWSNDYYIVTNRRVLFVEKIILLYDSRQEAPLTAILSVNTQTDVIGRTFGYGDVIVRTFVGNVIFKNIGYPEEVEALLREYWDRTKKSSRQSNIEAMKLSIRQKLGLTPITSPPPPPKLATKPIYKFNLFKVRFEEKGIITYRKHWFVWFKQTWLPGILALSVLGFIIWDFIKNGIFGRDTNLLLTLFFFVFVPLSLWWLYQTVDWSNDKFQVSEDQIFDIDRTPFGRMQKNVAPLDNILNMEARREGLLQVLFNYGNVYISVGGSQLVFEDVINPDAVQQDIDQRRVARREKQEQERTESERERLAEFFAAYHQNASAFQSEVEEKDRQKQSEIQPGDEPESPQD